MTTTPTLPPLPPPRVLRCVMPDDYRYGDVYGYTGGQMQAYALCAYQAGIDAGKASALSILADNALAATCQSTGQYRDMLTREIEGMS